MTDSQQPLVDKRLHVNTYSLLVILFISLSSTAYGYAGSIIATTLTQPSFQAQMKLAEQSDGGEGLIGAMNSVFYAGGMSGSLFSGWCCRVHGRKMTVAIGNIFLLLSGALLAASMNPGMFITFRFFSGFGAFTILSSVPVWIAELAPPKIRGILTDCHAVFMMLGYTWACYMGLAFFFVGGINQWRGAIGLQMVLPAIILTGIYWMPESPRFLISKDRIDEAHTIICRMHSDPSDPNDEFARREFYQIRKQIELDQTFATSYWEIFKRPSLRRRAFHTILLEFCLMTTGILVILNYGSIIWKSLGFDTLQILHFQCGFQLCGLVFNIVAMSFVDKIGRPKLISCGFITTAAIMATEMALQRYYVGTTSRGGLIACAVMIFAFQTSYSLMLDGPTFFYVAEIWPSHLRSQGFGIAMATLSLTCLMWLQVAPTAFTSLSWRFYLFFVTIPAAGAVFVIFFFKDTLHKPLEEIAADFGDKDMVAVYQRELNLDTIAADELNQEQLTEKHNQVEKVEHVRV